MHKDEGTARVEAFSDGVIAIAITLLVLSIKTPDHATVDRYGLTQSLVKLWPSYLAFVISFLSILLIWVKHHWMVSLIKRTDHAFLYWNGILLICITFLPFPTGLLAEYLLHPDGEIAASLYSATFLAISLAFKGLWWHATEHGQLLADDPNLMSSVEITQIAEQGRYGPILYMLAFGTSFFSEFLCLVICLTVSLLFMFRDWKSQI